jgi:dihydroneopterin aldolase
MTSEKHQDRLIISGLEFHGHCGTVEEERVFGQRLSVDAELVCDVERAGRSDRLSDAVDYAAVCRRMAEVGRKEQFHLIEALAERLADLVLREFPVDEVRMRLKKIAPPIEPVRDYVAVEIHRRRGRR